MSSKPETPKNLLLKGYKGNVQIQHTTEKEVLPLQSEALKQLNSGKNQNRI